MEHGVLGAVRAELDRDDERTRLPFGFVERRDQRRTPAVEQRFPFEVEQFAGDRRRFAERAAGSADQQHPALSVGFVGVGDVPGDHRDVTVGEVDDPHQAEHQREPAGEHAVEAAEHDPLDDVVDPGHASTSCGRRSPK